MFIETGWVECMLHISVILLLDVTNIEIQELPTHFIKKACKNLFFIPRYVCTHDNSNHRFIIMIVAGFSQIQSQIKIVFSETL